MHEFLVLDSSVHIFIFLIIIIIIIIIITTQSTISQVIVVNIFYCINKDTTNYHSLTTIKIRVI